MASAMAMSPSSSPRLPSPPPIAEDQLGPKSPIAAGMNATDSSIFTTQKQHNEKNASRRIRPGTKSSEMPQGPPLVDLADIDTAYQLSEHLRALYNAAIHPDPANPAITVPIDRTTALKLASPPKDIDKAIWLYELCRFLCEKLNLIIIALFADEPPCSAQTCVEMRASEWQYLCAVHDPPKMCCAIDYCCHTLDWAANVLTSQKHFPSRMFTGQEGSGGSFHTQMRQLTNIYRRVYRVFAHAWFQHRDVFWKVEKETGLYIFFKTVCDVYGLNPGDNCTVPPEAEGLKPAESSAEKEEANKTEANKGDAAESSVTSEMDMENPSPANPGPTNTTKRHRANLSVDSATILTVLEEREEDEKPKPADENATTNHNPVTTSKVEVERDPKVAIEKETEDSVSTDSVKTDTEPDNAAEIEKESEAKKKTDDEKVDERKTVEEADKAKPEEVTIEEPASEA